MGRAVLCVLAVVAFCMPEASAQIRSNIAAVNLTAILGDSISVAASPGLVNFNLVGSGVSTGNPAVTITTAWVLGHPATISTYSYFSNSASALTDGAGHNIPTSSVSGNVDGGGFTRFTGACPFSANTCVRIWNQHVPGPGIKLKGTHNDTLQLQISTVGLTLPAGTYTGVLHIQAQAL